MDRFWSKVNKNGRIPPHKPELGQCWVWIGSLFRRGYGKFWLLGKTRRAHIVSYTIAYEIPEACVLHKCDNPGCVRPEHLYVGSNARNSTDMVEAGRQAQGETHGNRKLGREDVLKIRYLASRGISYNEIIRSIGLDLKKPQVSKIVNRHSWKHV